jgi:hypothetical protein
MRASESDTRASSTAGRVSRWAACWAAAAAALAGCGGGDGETNACENADGALNNAGFIFVQDPRSGERVDGGFEVAGCSSTFEASVNWRLRSRDGTVLSRGVTQGGSLEPGSFAFQVEYSITGRQVGALEVYEPRVTNEGFPPSRDVVPLVLAP